MTIKEQVLRHSGVNPHSRASVGRITGTAKDVTTQWYDPLIDYHFQTTVGRRLQISRELLGQKNEGAKLIFDGAAEFLGWRSLEPVRDVSVNWETGTPNPSLTISGMGLAKRKLGDDAANPVFIFTEPRMGYRMPKGNHGD